MMDVTFRIGIVGPVNPYDLRFFLNSASIISTNNSSTSITTYVRELCSSGFHVSVFMFNESPCYLEYHGELLNIYAVPWNGIITGTGVFFRMKRLYNVIKTHLNDVSLLHAQWTYEYAFVAQLFSKTKPIFCSVRDWCPYILSTIHNPREKILWYFRLLLFNIVMNNDNILFIANSNYTYSCIKDKYPNKHVYYIPNPIHKGYIIDKEIEKPNNPVFISIAQTVSNVIKNNITTVKAFQLFHREYPNSELWFVGNTNKKGEVETYVSNNSVENVLFLGKISHDNLFTYIDKSSCLIHASIKETFGNILLEAMARKKPCIGGINSGGVPQVLEYGECGILCDVNDEYSICEAMKKTLDHDFINKLTIAASKKLRAYYSSDINMCNTIDIYKEVII